MRVRLSIGCLAIGVGIISLATASAQEPGDRRGRGEMGFGMGRFSSPLQLISMEPVQKELALKEDQLSRVKLLGDEVRKEMATLFEGADFQSLRDLPEEDRRTKRNELRAKMTENFGQMREKYQPKLAEILDAPQLERLQQIAWQAAGSQAYQDPAVVKAIDLSKEQQDKLASVRKEYGEKQAALFGAGAGGANARGTDNPTEAQERRTKMRDLNDARDKALAEVLTSEQRDQLEKLKGKPFDLAQLRRSLRDGRGGAGRDGRPRNAPSTGTN